MNQTTEPDSDEPAENPRDLARRVPRRGSPPAPVEDLDPDDGRALAARIPRRH